MSMVTAVMKSLRFAITAAITATALLVLMMPRLAMAAEKAEQAEKADKAARATSFEQAVDQARPVKNIAGLFDPLFEECKEGDELVARQCRDRKSTRLNSSH